MNILTKLFTNGAASGKSFFDYSAREKKKIIKEAAKESNRLQLELVKKYFANHNPISRG